MTNTGQTSLKNKILSKNPFELDRALRPGSESFGRRVEAKKPQRIEFTIFSKSTHVENVENPQKINELVAQVKEQVDVIKKYNSSIQSEVHDIEKVIITGIAEGNRKGAYIENVLEVFLFVLRNLTAKLGEAKTWLTAMETKKAKRGSAFAARSKKKGTSYSMSQELQAARSVM
ncbi:hypothetical protein A3D80_04730 [Candidatus Roizmanbacteria bacterium RIFCSPHIGHO2_02_FULL_40_13b]|uniref:DUF5660 domain-containing protein n=1 Tax=Candidatus Roizmanbacteria bacterium RIFCSPHIGHO2_01_FULL_39_24 TaxID=1802032 RepID=A0A1F7GL19_9BACT|nr:MAG: hypothetical protein A2799_04615 [Candidatus Roizmanbacteria bacterium RIFCSPHIGHO2_01_FULL_39_24]OGK28029.1 MAG: hypothetical protein A3D80_04730 [Candidatus Roizmanbacteria bacterium RIFCSPHIGHO2_02_FULL_40_13b]OGK50294.1 MAG: hypothetical protein A3A56_04380 [Candidatus Roizmanbacteria bacterium RIFCSPLOWO2_01_FULL_40_32]OGK56172.1 MAG: hypothetical protein A3H83_00250 [Candidatus Roizmanbacteria bacterium RIFCSPLOWO2_02_FULL_39_8]